MRTLVARAAPVRQQGMTLIIVLIALVSISLGAVALIRSVDTGTVVLGNLGFKKATTAAADNAAERAAAWLMTTLAAAPTQLYDSRCAAGCTTQDTTVAYYATGLTALDVAGHAAAATRILVDWDNDGCAYAAAGTYAACIKASPPLSADGFTTSYVLMRVCTVTGDPAAAGNNCARPTNMPLTTRQVNKGGVDYGRHSMLSGTGGGSTSALIFRIVARARGPRNTVSYTETYLSVAESS